MISLADALGTAKAGLAPVSPIIMPLSLAIGRISAETIVAPGALPAHSLALRAGYAVSSLACIGASSHSPVWLNAMPVAIQAGEPLPPGCDAVLPKDGFSRLGPVAEVVRGVAPGENARLAGHDLRPGTVLVQAGAPLAVMQALLLREAGITRLAVRQPRVAIKAGPAPLVQWLTAMLVTTGCGIVDHEPDLALGWSRETEPRLALVPGELALVTQDGATPTIAVPPRFDGLIAAYFALVLPMIETLRGALEPLQPGILRRKLTSTIGMSEIALLRTRPDGLDPVSTGALTLQALAEADRIALVPPDCEGYPAGATIATWPVDPARIGASFMPSMPEDPS